jgi:hypothetical protein
VDEWARNPYGNPLLIRCFLSLQPFNHLTI